MALVILLTLPFSVRTSEKRPVVASLETQPPFTGWTTFRPFGMIIPPATLSSKIAQAALQFKSTEKARPFR
ncbi:hypothetical protein, partial [Paracoccus sp. SY]|uniref:hypothetical protein n=1 Tax=Paracoccus sp. SY TaxID=1330255 RepID=UPI00195FB1E7